MSTLTFDRLSPLSAGDLSSWQDVFRRSPSFVYATEGRRPTDADAERIMKTEVKSISADNVYIYAVRVNGDLAGAAYLLRGYPKPEVAYVALLILAEEFQGRYLGVQCLRYIESLGRSWNCTALAGVVDAANARAVALWQRLGFRETSRRELPGLVGAAIVGEKSIAP